MLRTEICLVHCCSSTSSSSGGGVKKNNLSHSHILTTLFFHHNKFRCSLYPLESFPPEPQHLPAGEGEEALVEGGGEGCDVPVSVVEGAWVIFQVAHAQVVEAGDDDDDEGEHLGRREHVLYLGGPLHVGAVDPSEET